MASEQGSELLQAVQRRPTAGLGHPAKPKLVISTFDYKNPRASHDQPNQRPFHQLTANGFFQGDPADSSGRGLVHAGIQVDQLIPRYKISLVFELAPYLYFIR